MYRHMAEKLSGDDFKNMRSIRLDHCCCVKHAVHWYAVLDAADASHMWSSRSLTLSGVDTLTGGTKDPKFNAPMIRQGLHQEL